MKIWRKHIHTLLWGIVILLFFTTYSIINFSGFNWFCTPDMYSDTLVSKLMWEQKSIFPEGWVFGNQFYVFVTPVVAALFYGLCGSVNLAMALATTFMTVLTVVSFWWMLKPFATKQQLLAGTAVLLGCVIGTNVYSDIEVQIFYVMASYYAGYMITLFVVFGDYIRTLHGKKTGAVALLIAAALSFCTGMHSLRQTAVMILPLLVFEGCRFLVGLMRRQRELWRRPTTLRVAVYTLANLLGLAAIRILDPAAIPMYGKVTFNTIEQMLVSLATALRSLRSVTGLKYLIDGMSPQGVVAAILVLTAVVALVLALSGKVREGSRSLLVLLCCSVLCTMGTSILVTIFMRSIYLFPWYAAAAVSAVIVYGYFSGWKKHLAAVVLAAALILNFHCTYLPSAEKSLKPDHTTERMVADYLVEEGYTIVYGEWQRVSSVAVRSDGALEAGSWVGDVCSILPYISTMTIYSEEDNDHAAYLVRESEEQAFLNRAAQMDAQVRLERRFEGSPYLIYTSDRQLMYLPEA